MKQNFSNFGYIRAAAATPALKVADIDYNTSQIIDCMQTAATNDCHLIAFPELAICSNSCGDTLFQDILQNQVLTALHKIAAASKQSSSTLILGAPLAQHGRLFNCAVIISSGKIIAVIPKTYLCNAKEYYEERWFATELSRNSDTININNEAIPFGTDIIINIANYKHAAFSVEICEDLWSVHPPSADHATAGASIIFNLSGSNEYLGKTANRLSMVANHSLRTLSAYVYSAAGPGESTADTLFSGHSMIFQINEKLAECNKYSFESQICYADIDLTDINTQRQSNNSFNAYSPNKKYRYIDIKLPKLISNKLLRTYPELPFVAATDSDIDSNCSESFNIVTTALARRLKTINCSNVVLGISGGLDSTLALLFCLQTFKQMNLPISGIHAITMPGFGTSEQTKHNAEKLAELLDINVKKISITDAVSQHFKDIDHDPELRNITYENSQARQRTMNLMNIANKHSAIVIGTGDLSEIALGWSTYNGDHMSMYSTNAGISKTMVKQLILWAANNLFNEEVAAILHDVCNAPISPELLPTDSQGNITQITENVIGAYELHDFFLFHAIKKGMPPRKLFLIASITWQHKYSQEEILNTMKNFFKRFFSQQFKRSCTPDAIKIDALALSPRSDWRMPSDISMNMWMNEVNSITLD